MNMKKYMVGLIGILMLVGCSNSSDSNKRNQIPVASFTFSCTDLSCDFDAGTSSDADGTIDSYNWSFGSMGVAVSNSFDSGGTYPVTLTVIDNRGAASSVTQDVVVIDPPTNFSQFVKSEFAKDANSEPTEINDTVFTDTDQQSPDAYDDLLMSP